MKIILDKPTNYVLVKQVTKEISEVEVFEVTDNPSRKSVVATTSVGLFKLWEGDKYDAIGQWTDEDVATEIKKQVKKK